MGLQGIYLRCYISTPHPALAAELHALHTCGRRRCPATVTVDRACTAREMACCNLHTVCETGCQREAMCSCFKPGRECTTALTAESVDVVLAPGAVQCNCFACYAARCIAVHHWWPTCMSYIWLLQQLLQKKPQGGFLQRT